MIRRNENLAIAFFDAVYRVPHTGDSGDRRFHADLDEMSEGQMREEFRLASLRFSMERNQGLAPSPWLEERCLRLKESLYGPR
jgi:hypothetical protein